MRFPLEFFSLVAACDCEAAIALWRAKLVRLKDVTNHFNRADFLRIPIFLEPPPINGLTTLQNDMDWVNDVILEYGILPFSDGVAFVQLSHIYTLYRSPKAFIDIEFIVETENGLWEYSSTRTVEEQVRHEVTWVYDDKRDASFASDSVEFFKQYISM